MSNNELMLDVSQAHELKLAFRRNGWTNSDIKKLSEGNTLKSVLEVVKGLAKVTMIEHLINQNDDPLPRKGYFVRKHEKGGLFEWNPDIRLLLSKEQSCDMFQDKRSDALDKKMHPLLNINVLDYLLLHPELIPERWKAFPVFFWGTILTNGALNVPFLSWTNSQWQVKYHKFSDPLPPEHHTALATNDEA